jgi:hypothetical protein
VSSFEKKITSIINPNLNEVNKVKHYIFEGIIINDLYLCIDNKKRLYKYSAKDFKLLEKIKIEEHMATIIKLSD